MRSAFLLCLLVCVALVAGVDDYPSYTSTRNDAPIWKVFCSGLYGGRLDSIVNPGTYSAHVHRVFGGNQFGQGVVGRTPEQQFTVTKAATCTSCSIRDVDNSNYWTADLYYKWPNGTYSLVPSDGLTVYYLSRDGPTGKNKTDPNWQPIPKGLRILAGDPLRRFYDKSVMAHKAIDYVCLNYYGKGFDQSADWDGLKNYKCPNGLRTQVFFPMCWDGKNLDSPDHRSHMSYPVQNPNGGDCPMSHPVRIPGVFYEHTFEVGNFPHGDGTNNFVWSMGDKTGYGHHGDFLSGWDEEVMRQAIANPACSNSNPAMAFGNNVKSCPPLAPYVKGGGDSSCSGLAKAVPLTENLGGNRPLSRMPGCYGYEGKIANCDSSPSGSDNSGTFFLYSNKTKGYVSFGNNLYATGNYTGVLSYPQLWAFGYAPEPYVTIQNQANANVMSAQATVQLVGRADTYEYWTVQTVSDDKIAVKSARTSMYLTVRADGLLDFNARTLGDSETFQKIPNNGGYVPTEDGYSQLAGNPAGKDIGPNGEGLNAAGQRGQGSGAVVYPMACVVLLALSALVF